jgi:hypothetical protein
MEVGHFDEDTFLFGDLGHTTKPDPNWMISDDPSGLYSAPSTSVTPSGVHSALQTNNSVDDMFRNPFDSRQNHTLPDPASTSPTILAAASTLMRNGHHSQQNGHQNHLSKMSFDSLGNSVLHKIPSRRETIAVENRSYANSSKEMFGYMPQGSYGQGVPANMRHKSMATGRALFPDGMAIAPNDPYTPPWPRSKYSSVDSGPRLQWGSDNNFAHTHFVPPEGLETVAQVTDGLLERVQTFQHQSSATTTQPSSPIMPKTKRKAEPHNAAPGPINDSDDADDTAVTEIRRSAKRRKPRQEVRHDQSAEDDEQNDSPEPKARRGKRPKRPSEKPARHPNPLSNADQISASARKNGRTNLTEEQRSSNHIKSEQKRRDIIKRGFQDVMAIVPDCRDSGISRSVVLMATCDWLDYLIPGNARLREQLARLEGGRGGVE